MATRLTTIQKKEKATSFVEGKTVVALSQKFGCTKLTVIRNLKKSLGELRFIDLLNKSKSLNTESFSNLKQRTELNILDKDSENLGKDFNEINKLYSDKEIKEVKEVKEDSFPVSSFIEIAPLNFDIENSPRKELSSVSISEIDFPKIVYMVVSKQIELEIKLIKDYPEWEFLPNDDLNRKAIEIYFDLKIAKRICNKEQKVIKVPNTEVFRIAAPILISRGISRIVSDDKLIAL